MASEPSLGVGDGSREKQRWLATKVYSRKVHHKRPKPLSPKQTLAAATADDANSYLRQPTPPDHHQPSAPPPRFDSSAASEDDASSLNRHQIEPSNPPDDPQLPDDERRDSTTSVASRNSGESREERHKLKSNLNQVRSLIKKIEDRELQLSPVTAPVSRHILSQLSPVTAPVTAPVSTHSLSQLSPVTALVSRHSLSQHSGNEAGPRFSAKIVPSVSEATSTAPAPARVHLSVSLPNELAAQNSMEREKRTPKANQYYRNSEFLLGKEKLPSSDSQKRKSNGSKKQDPGVSSVEKSLYGQAFKSCGALLSKLMKHKFGWVFNTPVDVKGLGLHDYYIIIKHPMDLGTVRSRLIKNWYKNPEEFAEDVRLTFRNAMTYNPQGQDVHFMAEHLSQIFEEQWPVIEAEAEYANPSYLPTTKKALPSSSRTLERSDSTVYPMAMDSKKKPVNHAPHPVRSHALQKPKANDLHKRDMTFEEKQRLSNNLQNLPPEKLDSVVQIIKKRSASLSQHDDEIEVDIDSFDAETLWELDRFVTNYKKSLSKKKRKAELAMLRKAEADEHRIQGELKKMIAGVNIVNLLPKHSRQGLLNEADFVPPPPLVLENNNTSIRSSSSSSSSSDSGSSSSDSDSESSSAYGSDAAHSPRT